SEGLLPPRTMVTGKVATPEVTVASGGTWVTLPVIAWVAPAGVTSARCPTTMSLIWVSLSVPVTWKAPGVSTESCGLLEERDLGVGELHLRRADLGLRLVVALLHLDRGLLALRDLLGVDRLGVVEGGLRARELRLRAAHRRLRLGEVLHGRAGLVEGELGLGAGEGRLRLGERGGERGGVDGGEHLARGHRLAGLDVHRGDLAGAAEVEVALAERREVAGEREALGDVAEGGG